MFERSRWISHLAAAGAALCLLACENEVPPPAAPSVDAPPALTNQNPLTLTGTGEASATISARIGDGAPATAQAAADGSFSVDITLNADADNVILVSQTVAGLESDATMVSVTHDGTAPPTPTLDPVVTPTRRDVQTLRGSTEANATLVVTGGAEEATGVAGADGSFEISIMLDSSTTIAVDNELSVVATDVAGNASAAATATIVFDPNITIEAPILDDFPAFTNATTVTLTGEAEAGVGITAIGGGTDGMTTVGDEGTFEVVVGLRPNQRNEILVFAVADGTTSPSASAVVVHDDIAPSMPLVDPQASPTGATAVTLTGESEPGVALSVTGGAADASGTADEEGRFVIDVTLTADADNALMVVATDAASNASDPAELDITQDSTLEVPVRVDPVSSPTSDPSVILMGTATPASAIEITGGAAPAAATSDATTGEWMATVTLNVNARNELHVKRVSSDVDTIVIIVHDDIAPDAPTLNTLPSPTGNPLVTVSGQTEARARVSVSGATAAAMGTAEADGRFSIDVTIAEEATANLSVIATDRAGNSSTPALASVTHTSGTPAAPIIDAGGTNPGATNADTHTVRGHVEVPGEGVTIRIAGGLAEATGPTDPTTGIFAIEVTLAQNVVNELSVTSLEGAIESPAAIVTITHDNIAPAAPDTAFITANANSGGLSCRGLFHTLGNVVGTAGAVEGNTTVYTWNETSGQSEPMPAAPGPINSTSGGSFSITQDSCATEEIHVKAIDAAGNVSATSVVNAT